MCDSEAAGKQQHEAVVNVVARFLIQKYGAFVVKESEEKWRRKTWSLFPAGSS